MDDGIQTSLWDSLLEELLQIIEGAIDFDRPPTHGRSRAAFGDSFRMRREKSHLVPALMSLAGNLGPSPPREDIGYTTDPINRRLGIAGRNEEVHGLSFVLGPFVGSKSVATKG
jgi:hypothetical protein